MRRRPPNAARTRRPRGRLATASWQVLAALAIATVFAFAVAQAQATAPGVRETQQVLAGSVRSAEDTTNSVDRAPQCAGRRSWTPNGAAASRATSAGRQLLGSLDGAELLGGGHAR